MKLTDDLILILKAHTKGYEDGMKRAKQETKRFKEEQQKAIPINKKIGESFSKAATQAGIFLGPLNALSGRLTSIGVAFNRFSVGGLAAGASMAGLIGLTKQAINQFSEWETQMLRQQALLKATGYASGKTAEQLENMAQRNAYATLASVEEMRSAIGILTTFKSVAGDTFERTIQLAQDMADTFPTASLVSATTQIAKALQDPENGLSALTRTGVTFSEQQKEQIKLWAKEGDLARAQKAILDEIAGQMSGASSTAASGLAGKIDTLTQNWQNFLASFNNNTAASSIFGDFVSTMSAGLEQLTGIIENSLDSQLENALSRYNQAKAAIKDPKFYHNKKFIEQEFAEAEAELKRIHKIALAEQEKRKQKEAAARAKSAEEQKKLAQQRKEVELKANQEKGAKLLSQMEGQLATEQERINQAYAKRIEQINNASIAQAEAEKRGFATVEQLKADLSAKALAKRDEGFQAVLERQKREIEANERKLQLKFDQEMAAENRLAAEKARKQKHYEQEAKKIVSAAEKFNKDLADLEYFFASKQQKIDLDHQKQLEKLEALELKKLGMHEKYAELKKKIDDKHAVDKLKNDLSHFGQLGQATAQFATWETQTNRDKFNTTKGMADAYFGAMASKSKKAFAVQKAFAIAEAVMNTYKMATAAYSALASIPYVGPFLGAGAAAAAIAFGMAQVSQIRKQSQPSGQFHQGIDYVPDTGNYTLLKGERVLDKRLNQDLKQDLANRRNSEAPAPTVNFNLSQLDTNGMEDMIRENIGFIYEGVREAYEDQGRTF